MLKYKRKYLVTWKCFPLTQWSVFRHISGWGVSCQLPSPLLWPSSPLWPQPRPWRTLQPGAGPACPSHGEHWEGLIQLEHQWFMGLYLFTLTQIREYYQSTVVFGVSQVDRGKSDDAELCGKPGCSPFPSCCTTNSPSTHWNILYRPHHEGHDWMIDEPNICSNSHIFYKNYNIILQ